MATDIEIQIQGKVSIEGQHTGQGRIRFNDHKIISHCFRFSKCADGQVCWTLVIKKLFLGSHGILSCSPISWYCECPVMCILLRGHVSGFFRVVYFLSFGSERHRNSPYLERGIWPFWVRVWPCHVDWDSIARGDFTVQEQRQGFMSRKVLSLSGEEKKSNEVTRAWDLEQAEVWCGWIRQFYGYEGTLDAKGLPLMVPATWQGDSDCSPKGLSRTMPYTWP